MRAGFNNFLDPQLRQTALTVDEELNIMDLKDKKEMTWTAIAAAMSTAKVKGKAKTGRVPAQTVKNIYNRRIGPPTSSSSQPAKAAGAIKKKKKPAKVRRRRAGATAEAEDAACSHKLQVAALPMRAKSTRVAARRVSAPPPESSSSEEDWSDEEEQQSWPMDEEEPEPEPLHTGLGRAPLEDEDVEDEQHVEDEPENEQEEPQADQYASSRRILQEECNYYTESTLSPNSEAIVKDFVTAAHNAHSCQALSGLFLEDRSQREERLKIVSADDDLASPVFDPSPKTPHTAAVPAPPLYPAARNTARALGSDESDDDESGEA